MFSSGMIRAKTESAVIEAAGKPTALLPPLEAEGQSRRFRRRPSYTPCAAVGRTDGTERVEREPAAAVDGVGTLVEKAFHDAIPFDFKAAKRAAHRDRVPAKAMASPRSSVPRLGSKVPTARSCPSAARHRGFEPLIVAAIAERSERARRLQRRSSAAAGIPSASPASITAHHANTKRYRRRLVARELAFDAARPHPAPPARAGPFTGIASCAATAWSIATRGFMEPRARTLSRATPPCRSVPSAPDAGSAAAHERTPIQPERAQAVSRSGGQARGPDVIVAGLHESSSVLRASRGRLGRGSHGRRPGRSAACDVQRAEIRCDHQNGSIVSIRLGPIALQAHELETPTSRRSGDAPAGRRPISAHSSLDLRGIPGDDIEIG